MANGSFGGSFDPWQTLAGMGGRTGDEAWFGSGANGGMPSPVNSFGGGMGGMGGGNSMLGLLMQMLQGGMGSSRMYPGGSSGFNEMGGAYQPFMPPRYLGPPSSGGAAGMPPMRPMGDPRYLGPPNPVGAYGPPNPVGAKPFLPPTYLGPPSPVSGMPGQPRYLGPPNPVNSVGPGNGINPVPTTPGIAYPQNQSLAQIARPGLGLRSV